MSLMPKREYLLLLLGDVAVLTASLWITLALRYLEIPSGDLFVDHLVPFLLLFVAWIGVFFLAGLYGRYTRIFRRQLSVTILYTQIANVIIAALFFFLIPMFGLAPKTILVLYLLVSYALIFLWRRSLFPRLRATRRNRGVLIASGPDARVLADEIASDHRSPFTFEYVVDTSQSASHEVMDQASRIADEDDVTFIVVDLSDAAVATALPILYDVAFQKERFALVDAAELFQEVFSRVPLTLINYEWILTHVSASRLYDALKRAIDVVTATVMGLASLLVYPFVMLAIKLEDGGVIFITQERVGRFRKPIKIYKFRSMTGNDSGDYGEDGKTTLSVTRVGRWLRVLRIDELPQLWNVFRGDLSIVGPRPELPALAERYSSDITYYNARYLVSPGLTGWAQLRHDRHPHHGADTAETRAKLSYDLYYLKNRSLMLDLFIMLQTVRVILTARGT
jgi:lipopolysaccharide/colanic/teichoic acid biosynthesis glycosyltransferase